MSVLIQKKTPQENQHSQPKNGLRGLVYWKEDLLAGIAVALVSMPLSLAIAVASGAPPVAGLITAIISGFILPLIGGSYVTISSPAAGMAPVLYQSIYTLGRGNLLIGYPLLLPLVILTGLIQLGLSRLRITAFTNLLPASVISGVLTSIGLIVLVKQIPLLIGKTFTSHHLVGIVMELPSQLINPNMVIMPLGLSTLLLAALFHWLSKKYAPLKILPPFFYALLIGSLAGLALPLASNYLLQLPKNPLESLVWPNFQTLLKDKTLWYDATIALFGILIVNTVESVATIRAVDKLDRFKRSSNPEKSLLGIGFCNIASGFLGGLTVIPEVMRSTVGILAGARTQWTNFWNALTLFIGWLILQPVLTHIPLTVLAAVLIVCSLSLCKPANWINAWKMGKSSFAVFIITVLLTLFVDLLWGLIGGSILSFFLQYINKGISKSPTE